MSKHSLVAQLHEEEDRKLMEAMEKAASTLVPMPEPLTRETLKEALTRLVSGTSAPSEEE